jgi:hypothetical protein
VLEAKEFPASISDLNAGLAKMEHKTFTHGREKEQNGEKNVRISFQLEPNFVLIAFVNSLTIAQDYKGSWFSMHVAEEQAVDLGV